MGRQLPIVATWNDEVQLLRFIQTLSPILPFVSQASQIDDLWFPDWEQREIPGQQYSIWMKAFPWTSRRFGPLRACGECFLHPVRDHVTNGEGETEVVVLWKLLSFD